MSVRKINAEDLRRMKDNEGLILQGCGGSLDEWVDGINDMLTESEILLDGTKFKAENCCAFENEGLTNLMFLFSEEVKLDMGKLAMWRLQTHEKFGGKWLSDYVDNRLGGFISEETAEKKKPNCKLIGEDGNIFNLMGIASKTLRQNGMAEQAVEMRDRICARAVMVKLSALSVIMSISQAKMITMRIWMIVWNSEGCNWKQQC